MKDQPLGHQHYPQEFLAETSNMTPHEAGIYIWLRGFCWIYGSLPADLGTQFRACKTSPRNLLRAWDAMKHLFSQQEDGTWKHRGIEIERAKQLEHREVRSEAGRTGAVKRWQTHSNRIATDSGSHESAIAKSSAAILPSEKRNPLSYSPLREQETPITPLTAELDLTPPPTNGKPHKRVQMTARQQATFSAYLVLHPKRELQVVSARRLWAEKVKDESVIEFLMGCLRREIVGDTTYLLGPGKWLAERLELYAAGVDPATCGSQGPPVVRKLMV